MESAQFPKLRKKPPTKEIKTILTSLQSYQPAFLLIHNTSLNLLIRVTTWFKAAYFEHFELYNKHWTVITWWSPDYKNIYRYINFMPHSTSSYKTPKLYKLKLLPYRYWIITIRWCANKFFWKQHHRNISNAFWLFKNHPNCCQKIKWIYFTPLFSQICHGNLSHNLIFFCGRPQIS